MLFHESSIFFFLESKINIDVLSFQNCASTVESLDSQTKGVWRSLIIPFINFRRRRPYLLFIFKEMNVRDCHVCGVNKKGHQWRALPIL